jgi:N-acetyl sugar amidotransferase
MQTMNYCRQCVLPDSRPNLAFDAFGICNACRAHSTKPAIDWEARERAFADVVRNAKSRSTGYDCLIPVSGGKDSTWQVVKCLEYGLKPLCVTWRTPARTEIGQKNIDNLISLGVDHIDYSIGPRVERAFMLAALKRFGATAVPMHMAIFNIPARIAVNFRIPLVVWGENSAFEYGGTKEQGTGFRLDAAWFRRFGVTHGTTANDWISDSLSRQDLTPYFGPGDSDLENAGVNAVFLGYYFRWDPEMTRAVAEANGFRVAAEARTGLYNYADIDDEFISIHHWLKWYKFGFTRLFDNLSVEIRNGRVSRSRAIEVIAEAGDQTPRRDIESFCRFVGIGAEEFFAIAETFRNHAIWQRDNDDRWFIPGFLIPVWNWS